MKNALKACLQYAAAFYSAHRRRTIAMELCGYSPRYLPGALLYEIRKQFGLGCMLLADLILFGWCFPVSAAIDRLPPQVRILSCCLGMLCSAAAFAACWDDSLRMLIKSAFVTLAIVLQLPWRSVMLILFLFEHIFSHPREGGVKGR